MTPDVQVIAVVLCFCTNLSIVTPDVQTTSCSVVFLYDFHPRHKAGNPYIVMTVLLINKENIIAKALSHPQDLPN